MWCCHLLVPGPDRNTDQRKLFLDFSEGSREVLFLFSSLHLRMLVHYVRLPPGTPPSSPSDRAQTVSPLRADTTSDPGLASASWVVPESLSDRNTVPVTTYVRGARDPVQETLRGPSSEPRVSHVSLV